MKLPPSSNAPAVCSVVNSGMFRLLRGPLKYGRTNSGSPGCCCCRRSPCCRVSVSSENTGLSRGRRARRSTARSSCSRDVRGQVVRLAVRPCSRAGNRPVLVTGSPGVEVQPEEGPVLVDDVAAQLRVGEQVLVVPARSACRPSARRSRRCGRARRCPPAARCDVRDRPAAPGPWSPSSRCWRWCCSGCTTAPCSRSRRRRRPDPRHCS